MAVRALLVLFVFAAVYLTTAGGGFLSDDFRWILESRVRSASDIQRLFVDTTGFYRPVISLGFAAIEWIGGTNPRVYGIALCLLAIACASAIASLARAFGLRAGAALLAASLWLLNPHGINMAILWVSGLTALCLVLFTTLTAIAVARGRIAAALLLFMAALLSKEEALLMPVPLLLIAVTATPALSRAKTAVLGAGFAAAEVVYFWLRSRSDAMTPSTAPPFYAFVLDPNDVAMNAVQYLDRSLTLSAIVILIALAIVRTRPHLDAAERRVVLVGAVWFAAAYGITVFLPVRSSLYALLPAVGGVLAAAALIGALWRETGERQRAALKTAAVILPLILLPVLYLRTERWTSLMRVTRATIEAVGSVDAAEPAIVFVDDRSRPDNLENGFRSLLPDAIELYSGRRPEVWMVPAPSFSAPEEAEPLPAGITRGFQYRDGRLERVDGRGLAGQPAQRFK